jgi:NitT/TauT family transport system substrate-binding protein
MPLIANDSGARPDLPRRIQAKSSPDEVLRILSDPNSKFSTIPDGTMRYAEFMSRVGTIKAKPASWKELFFPPVHALPGS